MGDDRPFVCTAPGCGQRFTNEDHLSVHKHKHEMTLKFGPARTDSVIIADQTPTPTRFLKNCEEVGLFNELASSFEQEFRKAHEDDQRNKNPLTAPQLPAPPLQTPSGVKEEDEGPLEVDSSPPGSPDSTSSMSDSSKEPMVRGKETPPPRPVVSAAPTPTIVRPGSLPIHLVYDPLHPTLPSPTSVITQTPPSNRQLGSPTGSFPLVMHLPNGQTVPLLPSPNMTSVISLARPFNMVPNIPGIPGPPIGGTSSGSSSPSGYSLHSEAKMRLKAALTQQQQQHGPGAQNGAGEGPGGAGSSPTVPQRHEQSQQPSQHSDTPSPAQPQQTSSGSSSPFGYSLHSEDMMVSPAQPTGGRRRRGAEVDPDERRQRFLERNRAAASRCRQKRKVWVGSLERKAEDLATMNVSLTNEVGLLRNEVTQLKQLLLAHKDCPVTAMQKKSAYIAAGVEENSRDPPSEPMGSPAPVIQHGPSPLAPSPGAITVNGLSVRAAEAVAMSVLAGMGAAQQGGVLMATQPQPAPR
ncbi:cyclic AMP-dependent transcription factor ATF-7-like isoform 2-T3 [Salvelinus alpinus]|uniref:Cyclic AMP-dependent transcription factor ATF-7-like isoform X1 n=1 Tax=Salvelinus namaycush TaxID=8040 RepID=A0A8U1H763_SALNM|nr:cyclic AMP-dependent transcription factor ATF-7-like isoform X1 [Salvelinus namaycush]XP_038871113.1 cyclic AMP-dependent transcription factor ATF-7-like isoform X1 [Salvelinus namaycush]